MAARYDITIEQGATWKRTLNWKNPDGTPVDLTGYSAKMQIRLGHDSVALATLSLGSGIALGGPDGTIDLTISKSVTSTFTGDSKGIYDLLLTSSTGEATRLIEGSVYISPAVTV